jgi:microcystin-dependent protein
MGQPYIGEIRMFAGNFPPNGWAFCNGQPVPISENETLFVVLGTTYGGDGEETFALPNLQSRVPMHQGTNQGITFTIGETAGVETVTLSTQQMPIHNHAFLAVTDAGNLIDLAGALPANSTNLKPYINQETDGNMNAQAVTAQGGSQPHYNIQPYLAVSFIISLFGLFPSQT